MVIDEIGSVLIGPLLIGPLIIGWLGAALIDTLSHPAQPAPWRRPVAATAIHWGGWLILFAGELLLFRRPWFAMVNVFALHLFVVLVNNAKYHSLREPFVFQDFEYFTDALVHPRLYIPFLGAGRALIAGLAFVGAITGGMLVEGAIPLTGPSGLLPAILVCLVTGLGLVALGALAREPVTFDPHRDIARIGLIPSLWRYGEEEFRGLPLPVDRGLLGVRPDDGARLPHVIAIQSESFVDMRRLFTGIRPEVLANLDALRAAAVAHGRLEVPAWGANTVRTEFEFLSGLGDGDLGVHRFNPYRRFARRPVTTLASVLQGLGYRTVCIHPYPASFYARSHVYPLMGFDEFIDIAAFTEADRAGPYIGDQALARKAAELFAATPERPLFVFLITMENHGPLHLERVDDADRVALHAEPPPAGCDDLTVYLRHLRNADAMFGQLRGLLGSAGRPGVMCLFGDHVPIMPKVYECLGLPDGDTDYVLWSTEAGEHPAVEQTLKARDLAARVLALVARIAPGMAQA